jgi:hypothetical protein
MTSLKPNSSIGKKKKVFVDKFVNELFRLLGQITGRSIKHLEKDFG